MTNNQHRPDASASGYTFGVEELIQLFDATFLTSHNTQLVRGNDEPIYLPASNRYPHHRVVFAHGFFRSALHEIAHWCIAGNVRRHIVDYGYWYQPDGRSHQQQRVFEQVERKPQALEWLFCLSAGHSFEVSCDNLAAEDPAAIDVAGFTAQVIAQLTWYAEHGLPPRAAVFAKALQQQYQQPDPFIALDHMRSTGQLTQVA